MNTRWTASLIGWSLAAIGAAALPALAQTRTAASERSYVVTALNVTPAGQSVVRESLAFRPDGAGYRMFLANADGTTYSAPVRFTPQGTIDSNSQDTAITCYNMAMSVLASERTPDRDPASVFVLFANSVVRIPLDVRTSTSSGTARAIDLTGESRGVLMDENVPLDAGIVIKANIDESGGTLRAATFDETQYVGTASQVAGHSTCTVRAAGEPAAATSQT